MLFPPTSYFGSVLVETANASLMRCLQFSPTQPIEQIFNQNFPYFFCEQNLVRSNQKLLLDTSYK